MLSGYYIKLLGSERYLKGPLFIFRDVSHLSFDSFVSAVHKALSATGVDTSKYAGHSFHIEAATTAAKLSIQDSLIRTMAIGRAPPTCFIFILLERRSLQ